MLLKFCFLPLSSQRVRWHRLDVCQPCNTYILPSRIYYHTLIAYTIISYLLSYRIYYHTLIVYKVDRPNSVHPLIRSTPHLRPPPGAARPPFRHERGGIARPRSPPQSRRDRNGHERGSGAEAGELSGGVPFEAPKIVTYRLEGGSRHRPLPPISSRAGGDRQLMRKDACLRSGAAFARGAGTKGPAALPKDPPRHLPPRRRRSETPLPSPRPPRAE